MVFRNYSLFQIRVYDRVLLPKSVTSYKEDLSLVVSLFEKR